MTTETTETTNREPKPEMSLVLSCPLPTEEGQTAQLFVESPRTYRILDVRMPEGAEAIGLMAGLQDVSPAEGETWSALLAREPVHVTKGQHVMVVGRNLRETRRLTASVVVRAVDDASRAPTRASIRERTTVPATPSGRPSEPFVRAADEPFVRFLIERAYVTYTVAYVQNGAAFPRALRAAIGTSFESQNAIVEKMPSRLGSSVVVEMPASIRAAIGASIRNAGPLGLHPEDVGIALDALTRAIANDRPRVSTASSVSSGAIEHSRSVERERAPGTLLTRPVEGAAVSTSLDLHAEMVLLKNTILAHEMRIADLEAAIRGDEAAASPAPNTQLTLEGVVPVTEVSS